MKRVAALLPAPRPRKQFRLATLVTAGVCATVGLTVVLQLSLVDHFALNYAQKQAELQLQQLSWQMRDSMNRVVSRTVAEVRLLTDMDEVRDAKRPEDARDILESLQRSFPEYAWIGMANLDGKVFAATQGILENGDVSARPWFAAGKRGLHASDYHPAVLIGKLLKRNSPEPLRFIDIAGPLHGKDGKLAAVLAVHLSWDWVRTRARELLTPALHEYGAEILIVRDDGVVLLGPEPMLEKKLSTESLRRAQAGGSGSIKETWPDGKVYLTGYSRTGAEGGPVVLRWSVLVRQPESVAMAGPHALERRILWLSTLLGVALAAITALFARSRLTRPMDILSGAIGTAVRASNSNKPATDIPVVDGFHEAQVLSRAMRELVRSEEQHRRALEALNEQLEATVAVRTAELEALLLKDMLTGLPNRRALMKALPEAMERARRSGKPCAILYLDLDGFKNVNDTWGHEEGDELLRQFGSRIAQSIRKTDMVARLAGDEFVVLMEMLHAASDAEAKGRDLLAVLQQPFRLKTTTVPLGASVGVAVHMPGAAEDVGALLARADRAMYVAKGAGKNRLFVEAA
jgi:diguanylate cyclase (GGDEF)-like protein